MYILYLWSRAHNYYALLYGVIVTIYIQSTIPVIFGGNNFCDLGPQNLLFVVFNFVTIPVIFGGSNFCDLEGPKS